jgi:hypothetical protein
MWFITLADRCKCENNGDYCEAHEAFFQSRRDAVEYARIAQPLEAFDLDGDEDRYSTNDFKHYKGVR